MLDMSNALIAAEQAGTTFVMKFNFRFVRNRLRCIREGRFCTVTVRTKVVLLISYPPVFLAREDVVAALLASMKGARSSGINFRHYYPPFDTQTIPNLGKKKKRSR